MQFSNVTLTAEQSQKTMAEKSDDVVQEEVEEFKVETIDNSIVLYNCEKQPARLV